MDVLESVRGTVEQNVGLINKCFQEVLKGLELKEKRLNAVQESVAKISKELDLARESIKKRLKEVLKEEEELKELILVQENGLRNLELRKKGIGLILEDVKLREEKLDGQEMVIEGLFERIELEKVKFESIQKSIYERFDEISREGKILKRSKLESELTEKILASRKEELVAKEKELEEREKVSASLVTKEKELEAKDKVLASRKEQLVAKESQLEWRERITDLKTQEVDAAQHPEFVDLRKKSGKRGRNSVSKNQEEMEEGSIGSKVSRLIEVGDSSESDSSSRDNIRTLVYEYPDPEFYDFGKDREENCFEEGQIWACYGTNDGMPRFYLQIRRVYSPGFKLRVTWLDAKCEGEIDLEDLPVACGKFRRGFSQDTVYRLQFSHQIHCEKGAIQVSYHIYPRNGEIWALFSDVKRKLCSVSYNRCEYEIVEILSDFVKDMGRRVGYLDKITRYLSLFDRRIGNDSFLIVPNDLFRFLHRVPHYQTNGTQREGVPKGSFELDPASLPTDTLK